MLTVSAEDFKHQLIMILQILFYTVSVSAACVIITIRRGSCILHYLTLVCGCVFSLPYHVP